MENLKICSKFDLVEKIKVLAKDERRLTTEILGLLRQVEKRRIHLEMGYSSLFEFTVKELGYDEASASRRVQAVRLIRELPEVEEKMNSGHLSLTVVAQAQRFFLSEEKTKAPLSIEKKQVGRFCTPYHTTKNR